MIRTSTTALLAAFLIAGSALAQNPAGPQTLAAGPTSQGVPFGAVGMPTQQPIGMPVPHADPSGDFALAGPSGDWYGGASAIVATVRGERLPVLVTTSLPGTPRAGAGVLGQTTTRTLFGDSTTNTQARFGARAELGYWVDPEKQLGIEGGVMGLSGVKTTFNSISDGSLILARPYGDVTRFLPGSTTTNVSTSALIAFPGVAAGSVSISDMAQRLYTGTLDVRSNVYTFSWLRIDSLLGYRYLKYDDHLQIQQTVRPLSGPFVAGTLVSSTDDFSARNTFHGLDVGLRADLFYDVYSLDLVAKVAGGHLSRLGNIGGRQVVAVPGAAPVINAGGLLALSSNIGTNQNNTWTGVPEVGATFGYQINPNLRLSVGYTTLVVPNALRSTDQIDTGINPNLIPPATAVAGPTTTRPERTTGNSDVWVHALNIGLELRY